MGSFSIRKATDSDLDRLEEIYAFARTFMAEHGNPKQWGATNWPPRDVIEDEGRQGTSYVCLNSEGKVVGGFGFFQGKDIEPTYAEIDDGKWLDDSPYGVVHRLAGDGSEKGIGRFCLEWVYQQSGQHVRIDTHPDNVVMQNLLTKLGYVKCGIIWVPQDGDPRIAYEKSPRVGG